MPRSSRKRAERPAGAAAAAFAGPTEDVAMTDADVNSSGPLHRHAEFRDPSKPSPRKRPRRPPAKRPELGSGTQKGSKNRPRRRLLKVRIKKFHAVARWSWNVAGTVDRENGIGGGGPNGDGDGDDEEDVCGICQNSFEGVAPGLKYPGDDCPIERGPCGHAFHLQCVNRWLGTKKSCPICRADWPT